MLQEETARDEGLQAEELNAAEQNRGKSWKNMSSKLSSSTPRIKQMLYNHVAFIFPSKKKDSTRA